MVITTPTTVLLPSDEPRVKSFLTYSDRSVQYQMHKLRQNLRWRGSDPEGFQQRMNALKEQEKKTLLFYTDDGKPYTYAGLAHELGQMFGWKPQNNVHYPESRPLPWAKPPQYPLRPYQVEALAALINARHGGVELPTGAGKTAIIEQLCKYHGLKTVVVTPSSSITHQIHDLLLERFGAKYVGMYGGSKKKTSKLITVCTAQGLARLDPSSEAYQELQAADVMIFDESHTCPAETFEKVCTGVLGAAPYRYFLSATQVRPDGSEVKLKGIIGPIVYRKSFRELVDAGYLARPVFRMFTVPTTGTPNGGDVNRETRAQLFMNPHVNALAADIAQKAVTVGGRQALILIDEYSQYDILKNYLQHAHTFVSGETPQAEREAAIAAFNDGKISVLVGTSAISTGVDLRPVGCLIYLQGGMSEIQVKQALGRGTRVVPGKTDVWVVDFVVKGSRSMERHAKARQAIYEGMGDVIVVER